MKVNLSVVVDPAIKAQVLNFVHTSPDNYWIINTTDNTFNRKYCALNRHNLSITKTIKDYSKYVYSLFNITQQVEEDRFGNFIGWNTTGGFVHPHTDRQNINGWEHIRINFLISKPFRGGNPVIENTEFIIMENNAWFNLASRWVHSSTPVVGTKPRIVLSLGAFVDPKELNEAKIY